MKRLSLFLVIAISAGCAHFKSEPTAASQEHRKEVAQLAWNFVEKELGDNAVMYGSLVQGSRFMRPVDIEFSDDAEAGVVVVDVSGEEHEPLGRIFVYLFCDPKGVCRIAQVA